MDQILLLGHLAKIKMQENLLLICCMYYVLESHMGVILVIVGYRTLAQGSCWSWNLFWLFEVRVLLKMRLSS